MNAIHVVGRKNHGKTTFLIELITELSGRGLCVGTIKHSSHAHELDTPGADSFRHRQAGAAPSAIVTDGLLAAFVPWSLDRDYREHLASLFEKCDLVLIEGDLRAEGIKIEVWRQSIGESCLAAERHDILAVVSDDRPAADVPWWPRSDVRRVADELLLHAALPARAAR